VNRLAKKLARSHYCRTCRAPLRTRTFGRRKCRRAARLSRTLPGLRRQPPTTAAGTAPGAAGPEQEARRLHGRPFWRAPSYRLRPGRRTSLAVPRSSSFTVRFPLLLTFVTAAVFRGSPARSDALDHRRPAVQQELDLQAVEQPLNRRGGLLLSSSPSSVPGGSSRSLPMCSESISSR
jgi:hypothetical protein